MDPDHRGSNRLGDGEVGRDAGEHSFIAGMWKWGWEVAAQGKHLREIYPEPQRTKQLWAEVFCRASRMWK